MVATPLELAQDRLQLYLTAEAKILQAQEYSFPSGRRVRKADLAEIRAEIRRLEERVTELTPGGGRVYQVAPR